MIYLMNDCLEQKKLQRPLWLLPFVVAALIIWTGLTNVYALEGVEANKVYNATQSMTAYNSIQEAVNAASPEDTLIVGPGIYNESVSIGVEDLTLTSSEGAAVTSILSGGMAGIQVNVNEFTVSGFTISSSEWAVNVNSLTNGSIDISGCVFSNANYAVVFIDLTGSSVSLTGNTMSTVLRGIYFEGLVSNTTVTIRDNSIANIQGNAGVWFSQDLRSSAVAISNNIISDSISGIWFSRDIADTSVEIIDNSFAAISDYGVYTGDSSLGICGTSLVTVADNTFFGVDEAVYLYYLDDGERAEITGNTMTGSGYEAISIDYISYEDAVPSSSVLIEGNQISDYDYGVYIYEIYYGSAFIQNNTFENCETAVYLDYTSEGDTAGEETDVRILNNTITVTSSEMSLDEAIYVYAAENSVSISGNTISGYSTDNPYEYGIYIDYVGEYGVEPALLNIEDNMISNSSTGIYIYDIGYDMEAMVMIKGNTVIAAEYALFIDNFDSYKARLEILENTFKDGGYGIYLEDLFDGSNYDEKILLINGNMITGNTVGINVYYCTFMNPASMMHITGNDICGNETGILLQNMPGTDSDLVVVSCNNLSDNSVYAIDNDQSEFLLNARNNWWGDASGPLYEDNGALGDAVNGLVDFDPWIKGIEISPASSSQLTGTSATFIASVKDSNDSLVSVCVNAVFTVSGVHNTSSLINIIDGKATFSYTGALSGTDAVTAGLPFAADAPAGLTAAAQAVWTAPAAVTTPPAVNTTPPPTGDTNRGMMLYLLLACGAAITITSRFVSGRARKI